MQTTVVDPAVNVRNLRIMRFASALGMGALVAAWFGAYLAGVGFVVENWLVGVFLLVLLPIEFAVLTFMIRRLERAD